MEERYDIKGKRFNRLTVLGFIGKGASRENLWECLCDCGNKTIVGGSRIRNGHTKSCGCIQKELASTLRPVIHGDSIGGIVTTEYKAWVNMKERCYDIKDSSYPDYGGRGIIVCPRWLDEKEGYKNFLADMGRKPTPKHSLDRFPDTNGNYEPSNCRWGTVPQQSRNRRSNIWVEYNGDKMVLKDFAALYSLPYKHLHRSIQKTKTAGNFTFKEVDKKYYNATNNY